MSADILRSYVLRRRIHSIDKRLFGSAGKIKENWRKYRQRAYEKFEDVELSKIRLYDLHHWFATMTYIKTRDVFHVKYLLGHRRLENTLIYTCEIAKTAQEAAKLIEQGFDYICDVDGVKLFRKRK